MSVTKAPHKYIRVLKQIKKGMVDNVLKSFMGQYTLTYLARLLPPQTPHYPLSFTTSTPRMKRKEMAGYCPETVGLLIKSLSEIATELAH